MLTLRFCPICGRNNFFSITGYDRKAGPEVFDFLGLTGRKSLWSICRHCGFLFQNPKAEQEKTVELYKSGIYRKGKNYSADFLKSRYENPSVHMHWMLKYCDIPKDARILDIGAGYAGAVKAFRDQGYEADGIEIDSQLCSLAKEKFGVELLHQDLLSSEFQAGSFDLIYSSHVHEHLYDFTLINSKIHTWLKDKGYLLVVLPTYRFSAKNGQGFINVFHNWMFTKTSLHNMFVISGFTPVRFRYPFSHSKAEVWGVARKKINKNPKGMRKDSGTFVYWEVKFSPYIFEIIYRAGKFAKSLTKSFLRTFRVGYEREQSVSE